MSSLFYPPLKRKDISKYCKPKGGFYLTYNCKKNYENIAEDCQNRCVYCDAHIDECGGEPFSLDHFRPRDVFEKKFGGILTIHPFNLYLSCQKCNVLKTNDWKGCVNSEDGETYISGKGYIDRFKSNIFDYLRVNDEGEVVCVNDNGPAKYMIGRLLLNRTNRVYIRKCREVLEKSRRVFDILNDEQTKVIDQWKKKEITPDEAMEKIQKLNLLLSRYNHLQPANIK
ncbi:MAG: hypothetical protein ACI96V_002125 [Thalassolituus oleivorans]|jgi:hypothetical protein